MAAFVLVHSPLVGPSTWEPVAEALRGRDRPAVVPTWESPMPGRPRWFALAAGAAVRAAEHLDEAVVLVGHSRAGAALPLIGDRLEWARRPAVAYLFVDAVLPEVQPGPSPSPPALATLLDSLADADGMLPPWPQWWPPGTMADLVPDPAIRAVVEAECAPVHRTVIDGAVPVPVWWPGDVPVGYLSFTYEDEASEAERRGWVVGRADGNHLQAVVDPEAVADLLLMMVAGLGVRP